MTPPGSQPPAVLPRQIASTSRALLVLIAVAAAPVVVRAQAPRPVAWERAAWRQSARVPTDSLATLVATAVEAPPERDQELFDAITCQLFRLDWVYGVEATDLATARMVDSLLPTPRLRARFAAVQERWPARSQSWHRCSVRDLPPPMDDLSIEPSPTRPTQPKGTAGTADGAAGPRTPARRTGR